MNTPNIDTDSLFTYKVIDILATEKSEEILNIILSQNKEDQEKYRINLERLLEQDHNCKHHTIPEEHFLSHAYFMNTQALNNYGWDAVQLTGEIVYHLAESSPSNAHGIIPRILESAQLIEKEYQSGNTIVDALYSVNKIAKAHPVISSHLILSAPKILKNGGYERLEHAYEEIKTRKEKGVKPYLIIKTIDAIAKYNEDQKTAPKLNEGAPTGVDVFTIPQQTPSYVPAK